MEFSVLMSIYIKENPDYFKQCLDSIYAQTLLPNEIVLVEDGPLTQELYDLIEKYKDKEIPFKTVPLEKNVGLGLALKEGVLNCSYEIIARMDTDDICREDRFEKQIDFILEHDVDVFSSHILEFETTKDEIVAERKVPLTHTEIVEYQKKRSAFNHMAVMFKKSAVIKAGNYKHCPLAEDDMLWVDMILSGAKCANIDDALVFVRTNKSMIDRRGGLSYYRKYKRSRKMILKTGFISKWDYLKNNIIQLIVCSMPRKIRRFVFFKLLHKKRV